MSDPSDTPDSADLQSQRTRPVFRVLAWAGCLVPVIGGVGLWIVTRSWFLILITTPGLEQKIGGEVRIGHASYHGNGRLVYEDVIVYCPGLEGPESQALRIARADVVIDLSMLPGRLTIKRVELDGVLLRVSEDRREPGQFNFATFNPRWESTGSVVPPTVRIKSAVIEIGTHGDGGYRPAGHRRVAGEMYPVGDGAWYDFLLQELDDNGVSLGDAGIEIEGTWNVESMEQTARITGLVLDDRMHAMCPQMAQLWWDRMQPEGRVSVAQIMWKKGEPPSVELTVDRMSLTIPLGAREFSASYQQGEVQSVASLPRMHVHEGTIRMVGGQLTLDNLVGEFGSSSEQPELLQMPYRVNFSIHDLPPFDWERPKDWMERVITTAPFEMSVRMDNFRLEPGPGEAPRAVELPRAIADTLARFNLTGWSLSTQVEVTRAAPHVGPDGEPVAAHIVTNGKAYIKDAVGAFTGFPYPLENVRASVEFDSDKVTLHYLMADGSENSTLRIAGTIAAPGKGRGISLTLTARGIPLDDRFREGLNEAQRSTFDVLLHQPSYEEIKAEGLLPDAAAIDVARLRQRQLLTEFNDLRGQPESEQLRARRKHLGRELEQLETMVDAGPFALGGKVDLDLTLERGTGPDDTLGITGTVTIQKAGIVYGRFAYPIYVMGGKLSVEKDRIVILDGPSGRGIPIATPGGGRGTVTGEVRFVRTAEGSRIEPAISIDIHQDSLSDLLYAAMPLTEQDRKATEISALRPVPRRSLIARLLAGSGLHGWLNHTGVITVDDEGRPTFDFAVELYDATAEPNEELFETMSELGLPSPKGLSLENVHALVQITPEIVRLVDFTGHRGDAVITADADVDLRANPIETELRVEFDNLEIERYLIELTPGNGRRKTAELWDRYHPTGKYDALLHYHSVGDEADQAQITIWPRELRIMIGDEPLWLMADEGRIVLHRGRVVFHDFMLVVRNGNRDEGSIELNGSYGRAASTDAMVLQGAWEGGQLASPLITETLRLLGAEDQALRYARLNASGEFDAEFSFQSAHGSQPAEYEFTIRPKTLGLRLNDVPIFADMSPGSEVTVTPGRIVIRELSGEHAGGTFLIDGAIDVSDGFDADVEIGYYGRVDSPQLLALLPSTVRDVLKELDIQGAEPVRLSDSRLRLIRLDPEDNTWSTLFEGRLQTQGASLTLNGVEITEVNGTFDILAEYEPDSGANVSIDIDATRALFIDRELTDVTMRLTLGGQDRRISVKDFRARVYNGIVTGDADIGIDDDSEYQAAFELGTVGLAGILSPERQAQSGATRTGGQMYASFRLHGRRGHPESRRGRGAIRVAYGRMADMPITLRVLQLFELMPPLSGTLDFADIAFYIDGENLVFETLFMECPTLQVLGDGRMQIPGFELDLRLRTQGTVPVLRDIVAAVSNTLFQVEVTGPITAPVAKLIPFPGLAYRSSGQVSALQARPDK